MVMECLDLSYTHILSSLSEERMRGRCGLRLFETDIGVPVSLCFNKGFAFKG
jgi:hypothetical protein